MAQPAPHVADPYRTLGVSRAATEVEIKAAHRKLAKRYHPDAGDGDTRRFLRVQEAYRVLSDPLLRREWDARHAPGPVRANRGERPQRAPRSRPAPAPPKAPTANEPAESPPPRDPRREPRSSRAYTWSAAEVPWWEEGVKHETRRRPRPSPAAQPDRAPGPQAGTPPDAPNEFDVYNRSSGAAWSMAARAYFRRGDQDLPRRGSFHHQGTQPLTAARARTAAEQERRRAAAAGATAATAASAAPVSPPPAAAPRAAPTQRPTPGRRRTQQATAQQATAPQADARHSDTHRASAQPASAQPTAARPPAPPRYESAAYGSRERIVPQALPQPWPSIGQRLVYASTAWLPFAVAIALASSVRIDEVMQGALMALTLGLFVAVPRLAYVLAVATLGLLVVGFFFIVALAWLGVPLPLTTGLTAAVGAALALGYLATAGMVALGPAGLRPWARQPQHVRTR